ncbi:hypothetical protein L9F63_002672, partial [Diploptera punctata]
IFMFVAQSTNISMHLLQLRYIQLAYHIGRDTVVSLAEFPIPVPILPSCFPTVFLSFEYQVT